MTRVEQKANKERQLLKELIDKMFESFTKFIKKCYDSRRDRIIIYTILSAAIWPCIYNQLG
jgi:hypothetical protein